MNEDNQLLQRYLDGDLSPHEAAAFRARLAGSPELQRELCELECMGALLRKWAEDTGQRAAPLLEPTLARVHASDERRGRHASLGLAVAALLLVLLPASGQDWPRRVLPLAGATSAEIAAPAAIERLEAADPQAQVFMVGKAGTPVVWLADDAQDDDDSAALDPG